MPLVPDLAKSEAAIVELTNAFRRENKAAIVKIDPKLSEAARKYAQFLAQSRLFSHTADGRRPVDRVKAGGYAACQVAENLALMSDSRGFETRQLAQRMLQSWKNSPGHRRNLLEPHVTEIGVGVIKAKHEETYYAVQLFGRPARLRYRFEVQNRSNVAVPVEFGEKSQSLKPSQILQLTACQPGKLQIAVPKGSKSSLKPTNGSLFLVKSGRDGRITITAETQDRVKFRETTN